MVEWEEIAMKYRADAERYKKEAEEAKAELKEFESCSHQLEAELDMELSRVNAELSKRNREFVSVTQERDKYKEEASQLRVEKYELDNKFTSELKTLKQDKEQLVRDLHRLEQKNDDLERELRITLESLRDTEKKFNDELELRALLTTELDSKEELKDRCQRLEDEVKDLKLDCAIKSTKLSKWFCSSSVNTNPSFLTNDIHTPEEVIDDKNCCEMDSSRLSQLYKHMRNGYTVHEESDSIPERARKKFFNDSSSHGIGSRVNALPQSLANSVSPVIMNLLDTIQALENKLLMLHPDRRVSLENGYSASNRH